MAVGKNYPLSITLKAIDKATAPLLRIRRGLSRTFEPVRLLRQRLSILSNAAGLPAIASGFRAVFSWVGRAASAVGGLTLKLGAMTVAAAAAGFALIRNYATAGDNLIKTSERLGIGVEALQEYRFAARSAGVESNTFDMAMQRMGRRVGEAANGMGEARLALRVLGVDARDAAGNVRTVEDLLPELADKLARVESPLERNALAMKLFDSEGVAMVQLLEKGSQGMAEMREEARRLGLVMDREAALGGESFTQRLENVRGALAGIRNIIAGDLLPFVDSLALRFQNWLVESQPQLRAFMADFVERLPGRLDIIGEKFERAFEPIREIGSYLIDNWPAIWRRAEGVLDDFLTVWDFTIGRIVPTIESLDRLFRRAPSTGTSQSDFAAANPDYVARRRELAESAAARRRAGVLKVEFDNVPPNASVRMDLTDPEFPVELNVGRALPAGGW